MIHAEKGNYLVSCDLSQAESWIVAYLSNDANMKHALKFDDIHSTTAKGIFEIPDSFDSDGMKIPPKQMYKKYGLITKEQRYTGKRTNHATSYKMGPIEFVRRYNEESEELINVATARKYQEGWHKIYPGVRNWWIDLEAELRSTSGTISNLYGRRITFFGPLDSYIKEAIACKPQSTVADHFRGRVQEFNPIPGGLKEIHKRLPKEAKIIQQGHDSAVVECPKAIAFDVANIMRNCLLRPIVYRDEEILIPVDGEMGEDWGNLEPVSF